MNGRILSCLICMLVLGSIVGPVSTSVLVERTSHSLMSGNILYVGGSGSNNYTKIQDAIDNATDGDTVYVFDDASPYVENIMINTSLSLIGEKKETTIINGSTNTSSENWTVNFGVLVAADNVTVRGFTIQYCNLSGIFISSNNNSITDNILSDDFYGIAIGYGAGFQPPSSQYEGYNTITNNLIIRDDVGIYVAGGSKNNITGNVISQTVSGIMLVGTVNSNISNNGISENNIGIFIFGSYNIVLYQNNITYNEDIGVYTMITSAVKILHNNFIGNNRSAVSNQRLLLSIEWFKNELNLPIRRNVWNGNYWDGQRLLPYKIPAGGFLKFSYQFQVDWHPAKIPYDIP